MDNMVLSVIVVKTVKSVLELVPQQAYMVCAPSLDSVNTNILMPALAVPRKYIGFCDNYY